MKIDPKDPIVSTPPGVSTQDTDQVYMLLRRGLGHELVTEENVGTLIRQAQRDGHELLATELREWRNSCAPAPDLPGSSTGS